MERRADIFVIIVEFGTQFQPSTSRLSEFFMEYGIWVKCQVFDVYEDGSKKKIDSNEGWLWDREYSSMELAKIGLAHVKEMLDDGWCDVTFAVDNAVTLECLRAFFHGDECSAPIQRTEHIVYHIEKR